MSVRRLTERQPEGFAFTPDNLEWARDQLAKYPEGRQVSAVIPLLWRAQEQMGGWLPEPALRYVADMLGLAYIRVYEIATFYTMFNLAPVGRYYVQLCGTTPCWLRGADELKQVCLRMIGEPGTVTPDGIFSWTEVECLGACVNAPMVQINKDYYEDLTAESFERLLLNLQAGKEVTPGPQVDRQASAPIVGLTTLLALAFAEDAEGEPEAVNLSLTDREAKKPGEAASLREADIPKPPLKDSTRPRRR
jgi:NADH-quinone oxidoreductase subunit E